MGLLPVGESNLGSCVRYVIGARTPLQCGVLSCCAGIECTLLIMRDFTTDVGVHVLDEARCVFEYFSCVSLLIGKTAIAVLPFLMYSSGECVLFHPPSNFTASTSFLVPNSAVPAPTCAPCVVKRVLDSPK